MRTEDLRAKAAATGDVDLIRAVEELAEYRDRAEHYDLATAGVAYLAVTEARCLEAAVANVRRILTDALKDNGCE